MGVFLPPSAPAFFAQNLVRHWNADCNWSDLFVGARFSGEDSPPVVWTEEKANNPQIRLSPVEEEEFACFAYNVLCRIALLCYVESSLQYHGSFPLWTTESLKRQNSHTS